MNPSQKKIRTEIGNYKLDMKKPTPFTTKFFEQKQMLASLSPFLDWTALFRIVFVNKFCKGIFYSLYLTFPYDNGNCIGVIMRFETKFVRQVVECSIGSFASLVGWHLQLNQHANKNYYTL